MDTDGDGSIGFPEFTLLDEERWRKINPFARYQECMEKHLAKVKF